MNILLKQEKKMKTVTGHIGDLQFGRERDTISNKGDFKLNWWLTSGSGQVLLFRTIIVTTPEPEGTAGQLVTWQLSLEVVPNKVKLVPDSPSRRNMGEGERASPFTQVLLDGLFTDV